MSSATAPVAPAKKPRNPHRDLPAEQVVALFLERLPEAMHGGLAVDRTWLWWAGDKPDDDARRALCDLGFDYTKRDHALPDGRVAHWYHACGGFVKRTGRGKPERPAPAAAESDTDGEAPAPVAAPSSRATKREPASPVARHARRHDPLSHSAAPSRESGAVASLLRLAASLT